ncbi:DUF2259 domain-containing protein [Rhizobium alvei]|uniref:DUF2259 domain-containing protein n=1 Tax=Rhizobium alvei TaxID=1132659 RepID=UPI0033921AC1
MHRFATRRLKPLIKPAHRAKRLAMALIATVALVPLQAVAGDVAQLNVLGYSPDGRIFAFEEFGVQDGSGFGYSNIYFIDTVTDRYLKGTPLRHRVEEEQSLAKARLMAHANAEALAKTHRLGEDPGFIVASNPITEVDSNASVVRFRTYPASPAFGPIYSLTLVQKPFPPSKACANMVGEYRGFKLLSGGEVPGTGDRIVHDDAQVPASRVCPNDYRIGAVVTSQSGKGPAMALITVSTFGFEGNDLRWIAVPVKVDSP